MCLEHRVLVVDDDISIRRMVQKILEKQLFTVDTARDGAEGIEKLKENRYSLVFLDLMMPKVDGFGVLRFIREHSPELLETVIVMTAVPHALRERGETSVRVLPKPFDMKELATQAIECHWVTQDPSAKSVQATPRD